MDQRYPTVNKNIFTTHTKGFIQIKPMISDFLFFSFQDWIQADVVFDFYKNPPSELPPIKCTVIVKKMLSLQNYKLFGTV